MDNIIVMNTLKAYVRDTATDKMFYFGVTSSGNVKQSIDQEKLRGDFGNKVVAILQNNKDIEFGVTPVLSSDNIIAIQSGKAFTSGTEILPKTETKTISGGEVAISGTPIDDEVTVFNAKGKSYTATYLAGTVTITGGTDGESVDVVYKESTSGVEVLELDSNAFPKSYEVTLRTIAHDKKTNEVVADIYWLFHNGLPDGNLDQNYEAGKNANQTINFSAIAGEDGMYGKYIVSPRS